MHLVGLILLLILLTGTVAGKAGIGDPAVMNAIVVSLFISFICLGLTLWGVALTIRCPNCLRRSLIDTSNSHEEAMRSHRRTGGYIRTMHSRLVDKVFLCEYCWKSFDLSDDQAI